MENNNQIKSEDNFSMPVDPNINTSLVGGLKERINEQNSKAQHPKGRTGLFIFVVMLFVILGVGGWWYYAQGQVMLLHRQMKLDLVQVGEHSQFETFLEARVDLVGQENEFLEQNNFISSQAKQYTDDNNNIDAEISLSFTTQGSQDKVIDLNIFVRKIAENVYLKLKVDGLEKLNLPFDIDFGDKWIALNAESLENNPFYPLPEQEIESSEELKVKVQELADNLMDLDFLKISNPHQTIKNNGDTLRKIKYNIKEDKLKDLILTYLKYYSEITSLSITETTLPEGTSLEDVNKLKQEMQEEPEKSLLEFINNKPNEWEKMKQAIAKLDIYLWVNTNTKNIQGLELFVENLEMLDESNKGAKINLDYKSMLTSVEPRKIDTPTDTQSIEEFIGNLMSDMIGGLGSTKTVDGYDGPLITPDSPEWTNNHTIDKIDSDSDGLSDAMESLYGTDINNPDSDGDGYLDGAEVENGYNPMGEGKLPIPSPSYNAWDIDVVLPDQKLICENSEGEWVDDTCVCSDGLVEYLEGCVDAGSREAWGIEGDFDSSDTQLEVHHIKDTLACQMSGGEWVDDEIYCLCPGNIKIYPSIDNIFLGCDL